MHSPFRSPNRGQNRSCGVSARKKEAMGVTDADSIDILPRIVPVIKKGTVKICINSTTNGG